MHFYNKIKFCKNGGTLLSWSHIATPVVVVILFCLVIGTYCSSKGILIFEQSIIINAYESSKYTF